MINIYISSPNKAEFNGKTYKIAVGKNGFTSDKKEGDSATPTGCMEIREVYYRDDRLSKPETKLPTRCLEENDGWCDDTQDSNYNKKVKLPYKASHEELWREDHLYDIIVVLGYNDNPPVPGKGSAIFMHIARDSYSPTEGCIAFSKEDLLEILKNANKDTLVCVNTKI